MTTEPHVDTIADPTRTISNGEGVRLNSDVKHSDVTGSKAASGARRATVEADVAQTPRTPAHIFGEVVSLLSESPKHRHLFLSDLEWFIAPPMRLGQFRVVYSGERLVGFATWASVSEQVDQELRQGRTRLKPPEWKSGDRLWLIDVVAPSLTSNEEGAAKFLSALAKTAFGGKSFKLWRLNPNSGRPEVVEMAAEPKETLGAGDTMQTKAMV